MGPKSSLQLRKNNVATQMISSAASPGFVGFGLQDAWSRSMCAMVFPLRVQVSSPEKFVGRLMARRKNPKLPMGPQIIGL